MEDIGQNGNRKENEKQPIQPPPENNNLRQPPPSQPPQQCPRCDSFNTKFCYYNNYSVSQPRYFCKSCRRYWTQGGTLRNVPVGGGCRKGAKRIVEIKQAAASGGASCSSSFMGECSRSVQEPLPPLLPPPPPQQQLPQPPLSLPQIRGFSNMGLSFANSFYSPTGIMSSFTTMQNLNRPLGFNQVSLNGGGSGVDSITGSTSANYSVLQGFTSNSTMIRASQVVQQPIYNPQEAQMMVNPNQNALSSWTQGFINTNNHPSSNNTTNVSWAQNMLLQPNNNINGQDSSMINPNQWPDDDDEDEHLPGYGPPRSSS